MSSNAFSLNQADIVLENAPDPANGKRFGLRLDLQFGQATETLQGNAVNEPRPNIYRNIFQAYGTYVAPIGNGLTVDFGKWASSIGLEGNYTKDQMNYSRSLWFDFLPFYHMGARVNYKVNDTLSVNYWITNGTNQTEPYNGYKDELFGLNVQPHKNVAWTINYYLGQEHPDFQYVPDSTNPNLPQQQGIPFEPIPNPANGKLHILDSYATWTATPNLTLAAEGDYVIERLYTNSSPQHTDGGALYARYQLGPRFAIAGRSEYLSDRGGLLFSGTTQAIKETTFTLEQKLAPGFLLREEWRRIFPTTLISSPTCWGFSRSSRTPPPSGWSGGSARRKEYGNPQWSGSARDLLVPPAMFSYRQRWSGPPAIASYGSRGSGTAGDLVAGDLPGSSRDARRERHDQVQTRRQPPCFQPHPAAAVGTLSKPPAERRNPADRATRSSTYAPA